MEAILSLIIAFVATAIGGKLLIPVLVSLKAGQSIKEIGPNWHMNKQGTPTMGGLMFILGVFIAIMTAGFGSMMHSDFQHLYVFGFALIFGVIGFLDDYEKVKHHQNTGLTAIQKFLLQLVVSVGFIILMRYLGLLTNQLYIPFWNINLEINWFIYYILAAFIIVGTVNAVNITDGVDGLCSSVTIPVGIFFAVAGILWHMSGMSVFSCALVGSLAGYLIYNHHPAQVFMGDTGSLFLGGAVAAMAFAYDMPLVLLLVGIIYICETMSDIIQVGYFKMTHGKRIFKMAPLHHHFEMCGWSENKIVCIFTSISAIFCILALIGVWSRF